MTGYCPHCGTHMDAGLYEVVRCPGCGEALHPEYLRRHPPRRESCCAGAGQHKITCPRYPANQEAM